MSEVIKMSIALTSEQVSLVKSAVETGDYATSSEVVRDALRVWDHSRNIDFHPEDIKRLRRMWDEGKASGRGKPFNIERTIAAAKARLKKAHSKKRRGRK
jgi:antitoxin ParD1/3/4